MILLSLNIWQQFNKCDSFPKHPSVGFSRELFKRLSFEREAKSLVYNFARLSFWRPMCVVMIEHNFSHKGVNGFSSPKKRSRTSSKMSPCTNIKGREKSEISEATLFGWPRRDPENTSRAVRAQSWSQATSFIELGPGDEGNKIKRKTSALAGGTQ